MIRTELKRYRVCHNNSLLFYFIAFRIHNDTYVGIRLIETHGKKIAHVSSYKSYSAIKINVYQNVIFALSLSLCIPLSSFLTMTKDFLQFRMPKTVRLKIFASTIFGQRCQKKIALYIYFAFV